MKKFYLVLVGIFLFLVAPSFADEQTTPARTSFSQQLERAIQANSYVQQNPGMGRLAFMRFYFPINTVKQEPGFWQMTGNCDTNTLIRAQAIYLYNMYISTAAYRVDVPQILTVDYLGALDGFSQCANGFEIKNSVSFYQKHRVEIKKLLQKFFAVYKSLPAYQVNNNQNDMREKAFLNLLSNTFAFSKRFPVYRASRTTRLTGSSNQQDVGILKQLLQRSLAKGRNKTITFEERAFEDGPRGPRTKITKTCRPVNEECAACSYMFGKEVCAEIAATHRNWGFMRMYRVEAKPKDFYLKTAAGSQQFTLANGKKAPNWAYHVATLVIMNLDGKYTPYMVDNLLGGSNPMTPNAWFQKFSLADTYFNIKPFQRLEVSEKRLM